VHILNRLLLLCLSCFLIACVLLSVLHQADICKDIDGFPLCDPAENLHRNRQMSNAVITGDIFVFLRELNRSNMHPPGFPLLLMPERFISHDFYSGVEILTRVFWVLLIASVFWLGLYFDRKPVRTFPVTAFSSAFLVLFSPILHGFGTIVMSEITGAALICLIFGVYLRSFWDPEKEKIYLIISGLGFSLLMLIKYNFIGFVLPLILLGEWKRLTPDRSLRKKLSGVSGVFLFLLFLEILIVRSEFQGISHRGASNLMYCTFILGMIGIWWVLRKNRVGTRILFLSAGLPVTLWLTYPSPNRFFSLTSFLINRDSSFAIGEDLIFYFQHLAGREFGFSGFGLLMLVGCFLSVRKKPGFWVPAVMISLILLMIHPYKLPRFLIPLFPVITVCGIAGLLSLLQIRGRLGFFRYLVCILLVFFQWHAFINAEISKEVVSRYFGPPALEKPLEEILKIVGSENEILITGTFNELSPGLICLYLEYYEIDTAGISIEIGRDVDPSGIHLQDKTVLNISLTLGSPLRTLDWVKQNQWKEKIGEMLHEKHLPCRILDKTFVNTGIRLELYRLRESTKDAMTKMMIRPKGVVDGTSDSIFGT